ncbi:MAG: hypothetical protein LM578_07205, partial [Desulfurococcaceae archaeon]|nr:hypothetical protein [Desulfurococcaceae archaeon]
MVLLGVLGLFSCLALAVIIVFAITAPLASVLHASGVDGRVYVVVPRSFVRWLEKQGYSLGSLFIAMMSPLDYEGYSYWLRGVVGDRLILDFRRVARSWEEFYRGNRDVLRSPPIPAVSITITLTRVEGDRVLECTAHYTYSTIDYFVEKGLKLEKAVESSRVDPLAHLRKPLVITLNPRMPKSEIKVSCADLSPIVEELRKAMGGGVGVAGENPLDGMAAQGGLVQQSTCPARFTEVWWSDVYNSINSPLSGWMSNIYYYTNGSPVPDSLKLRVWSAFARNWSLAYYYRADSYSVENAKFITLWELFFRPPSNPEFILGEKVYWLDEWVNRVFKIFTDPYRVGRIFEWKDYHENNPGAVVEWTDYQPFFGMRWENPNKKAFAAVGGYAVGPSDYYKHGVTIAGFIFLGKESLTIENSITVSIGLSPGSVSKAYVGAKTTYRYLGDGILLRLEVQPVRVVRSGVDCGVYWRVIPVHGFIPLYSVTIDLASLRKFNNNEPPFYDEILYLASLDTVYYAPVYNPQPGTVLYQDNSSHVASIASDPNMAFIVSNLFLPAFELLIDNIGCKAAPVPVVCAFVSLIASNVVSYAYEDLYDMAIAFDFTLVVGRESAIVRIDKV